ncbi:hypothetical protein D3C78_1712990 [compost metagenome]
MNAVFAADPCGHEKNNGHIECQEEGTAFDSRFRCHSCSLEQLPFPQQPMMGKMHRFADLAFDQSDIASGNSLARRREGDLYSQILIFL